MSKYGTRLNVLWAVVALLSGVSQLSKAVEGNGFAIVVSLAAAILFVVALMGAVRSSRQNRNDASTSTPENSEGPHDEHL